MEDETFNCGLCNSGVITIPDYSLAFECNGRFYHMICVIDREFLANGKCPCDEHCRNVTLPEYQLILQQFQHDLAAQLRQYVGSEAIPKPPCWDQMDSLHNRITNIVANYLADGNWLTTNNEE